MKLYFSQLGLLSLSHKEQGQLSSDVHRSIRNTHNKLKSRYINTTSSVIQRKEINYGRNCGASTGTRGSTGLEIALFYY